MGTAAEFNIDILERFQSTVLWIMPNARWYVSNHTIAKVSPIIFYKEEMKNPHSQKTHTNSLAKNVLLN